MAQTTVTTKTERRPRFVWRNTDTFWVLGAVLMIIGAFGMTQRLTQGLAPTSLGSYVPWGLWVGFYDYLVWLEVGSLLVFTSLLYLVGFKRLARIKPLALFTGFVVLMMALLVVLLDLGQAMRFWHVLIYPTFSSMISWMVWLHILYMLVLVAELALVLGFVKVLDTRKDQLLKILAYLTLPMGLGLIIVSGSVFGVVVARPLWSTSSLPLMFLVSALAAGSGLLLLLVVLFWPEKKSPDYVEVVSRLSRITAWFLLAGVFAASIIGFTALYQGGDPAKATAMQLILTGPFWWSFWIIHVLLGVFIPILLLFLRGHQPKWAGVGAFLAVITFVAVTLNVVIPVLATPELEGLATAFHHAKLNFDYVPNIMEWLTILFVFGLGSFLYGLGLRFLPILEKKN
ncbi:MAG: polysulfide reductase NrfD [Anaerolineaceae bacterium]|nr:polysulfide reductase NrfD [Anaerolineaceae bacterium]